MSFTYLIILYESVCTYRSHVNVTSLISHLYHFFAESCWSSRQSQILKKQNQNFVLYLSSKSKEKKSLLRFGQFVDIWLFWHLNVNHFEMSYSIRNRWRNRASPFQTDQKHVEEMWIVLSSALSVCNVFITRCVWADSLGQPKENGGKLEWD